jgi:peptide chain release factor 1
MLSKLEEVEKRFEQVGNELQNPDLVADQKRYRNTMKEYADLEDVVRPYREYKKAVSELSANKGLLLDESDEAMREMIRSEIHGLEATISKLQEDLRILLLPKDPNDSKNIILEIRAGAGGDEASLFVEELFRSYSMFAGSKGWTVALMSASVGNVGGYKEVIASISGEKVYSHLKFESGVHRVQRVPKTETQGRVHTSTVTVAVLPEADDVEVNINQNDVRVDVMRASGAGGQSVNRTESAVRLTHLPTGIIVYCQEGKSQNSNKEKAYKILMSRLLALEEEKARQAASDARLSQIGTGDRSERIRTYNFPQSRVTDHRIGFTSHQLGSVMEGKMEIVIEPVITHFQAEALKAQGVQG